MSASHIRNACQIVGSQKKLAKLLGITPSAVSQWVLEHRPIPAEQCPRIEEITLGQVRCEDLRPDIKWSVLRTYCCKSKKK